MEKIKDFFKRLAANKYFKRLWLPGVVIIIGVLLLITQCQPPPDLDTNASPSATPSSPVAEISPPPETPMDDGSDELDETPTPPPETPTPDPGTGIINPLTGEPWNEDLSDYRPWAVAIDNHSAALPQLGISKADIICEFLVEGGITRIIAIYQDVSYVGTIGGIRSLRTSAMEIAQGYDAIFTHWSGNTYDQVVTHGNPVTRYNTIDASSSNIGYRYTGKTSPHNAVASGERLANGLPSTYRTEHDGFEQSFVFTQDGTPDGGLNAERINVIFYTGSKYTEFTYNENDKLYYVRQYSRDMTDGNDSTKPGFTNVLIVQTPLRPGYNAPGHTYVTTTGTGTGYFACGGKYVEITWSREDLDSPYSYYLTDGTPLELGVGKTYICIIDDDETPSFS